uniref:Ribonuclease Z n=1 Tax=Trichogloeopsis pedicellata TaxID=1495610 RepID=A0A1G4P079_9FLOR|nr:Ribonuclease Z [Trichogloeopsis pedicellata]SCW24321.1 Ribonuclease Z [Trichogloeopsis pedicellata]
MLNSSLNFLIRCSQNGEVWLFNCPEGCQQLLHIYNIKITQIRHIVLTSLKIKEISGLIGLLSSLSLNGNTNTINLYGPHGLLAYINLIRKYSHTTFRYNLKIYVYQHAEIYKSNQFHLCTYPINKLTTYMTSVFFEKERKGRFQLFKAKQYGLQPGPVYKYLKLHTRYILPDGTIISGKYFTDKYSQGTKILCLSSKYGFRFSYELIQYPSYIVLHSLTKYCSAS